MIADREAVLDTLSGQLANMSAGHPLRVAIDGRTASGKTTLAAEVVRCIGRTGRPVIASSIDGFHRPKAERYARGRLSAEGYYHDARDHGAIRRHLLGPLGPGGSRLYRTIAFDLENDRPIEQEPKLAPHNAVLIVDGTFLQRPELKHSWDLVIYVSVPEALSRNRGIERDADLLGGVERAEQIYARRYLPAEHIYHSLCAPEATADVVWENSNFERPVLRYRQGGRLTPPE